MPILDTYVCDECGDDRTGWRDDEWPDCCDKAMRRLFCTNHFEWGGPRHYRELRDEPFESRSDMARWAKESGLECVGDKKGGARNEDHRNLGKIHSYKGAPTKRSELF